jgi:hypothetical protein
MAKKTATTIVLIRTYSAGVHVGELVSRDGKEVTLKDAHRVWRWRGANTLHELSQKGADSAWSRISERVPSVVLTEAIEVLECSPVAADNLRTPRWPA